ncbi:hypothetical protein D9M68_656330 [compost metagenome]
MRSHIGMSKAEIRKITLHMLHEAREREAVLALAGCLIPATLCQTPGKNIFTWTCNSYGCQTLMHPRPSV